MNVLRRFVAKIRSLVTGHRDNDSGRVDVPRLEKVLGYSINNQQLFVQALSHRSSLQLTGNPSPVSNERLEFLGDAVLNLVVAEYVYRQHANAPEGDLTKIRSRLVNRKALSIYANDLSIADFMLMSPSASQVTGRGLETILADAFEAVIGAVYLDGGFQHASTFVEHTVHDALQKRLVKIEDENFKSRLLEYSQANGFGVPRYITVNEVGPDHDRTFTIEVMISGVSRGTGHGKNKKDAEQAAAEKALYSMGVLTS